MSSKTRSDYRIREVDANEWADELNELNDVTFGDSAPSLTETYLRDGHWWLCFYGKHAGAFAGSIQSERHEDAGYLCRAGVLPWYRGHRLQRRLLRVREGFARRLGWRWTRTDTTDNIASANSLIAAGYRLFQPAVPWLRQDPLLEEKINRAFELMDMSAF
jgi:hypothetical protein